MKSGAVNEIALPPLPVVSGYELHTPGPLYALMLNLAAIGGLADRGLSRDDPSTLQAVARLETAPSTESPTLDDSAVPAATEYPTGRSTYGVRNRRPESRADQ